MTEITQTISTFSNPINRDTQTPAEIATAGDTTISEWTTIIGEENTWAGQVNTVAGEVNTAKDDAETAQTAAELAETNAEAAQAAAENASDAEAYDSGIIGGYAVGDVVYSTAGYSYRCIQVQAEGAVEALTNTAYWTKLGGTTGIIYSALGSDETWTGLTETVTAGENLTLGEVVYLKPDGKYWLADADGEATAGGKLAMATASISADADGVVLLPGSLSCIRVDATTEWTVTTLGENIYLSTTAGELTNDVSGYTTLDIVRVCGKMKTTTILNFDVSGTFIEVA